MINFLHPGDLSISEWLKLFAMIVGFIFLPVGVIVLIIYKVIKNH